MTVETYLPEISNIGEIVVVGLPSVEDFEKEMNKKGGKLVYGVRPYHIWFPFLTDESASIVFTEEGIARELEYLAYHLLHNIPHPLMKQVYEDFGVEYGSLEDLDRIYYDPKRGYYVDKAFGIIRYTDDIERIVSLVRDHQEEIINMLEIPGDVTRVVLVGYVQPPTKQFFVLLHEYIHLRDGFDFKKRLLSSSPYPDSKTNFVYEALIDLRVLLFIPPDYIDDPTYLYLRLPPNQLQTLRKRLLDYGLDPNHEMRKILLCLYNDLPFIDELRIFDHFELDVFRYVLWRVIKECVT